MTTVDFCFSDGGHACFITAEGHAGYAKKGQDIVCAGISTLLQTLELYLKYRGESYEAETSDGRTELSFAIGDKGTEACAEYCMLGILALEKSYPEYIKTNFQKNLKK